MTITLRQRIRPKRISLYLEYYENGKRTYENLPIHLIAGDNLTAEQKERNKQELETAESIATIRKGDMLKGRFGIKDTKKLKGSFIKYAEMLAEKRRRNKNNYQNWLSALRHLKAFCKEITFADINKKWLEDFRAYLQEEAVKPNGEPLAPNSQSSYFNKVRAAIKEAFMDEILLHNPAEKVEPIKGEQSEMCYLTEEEAQKMADAECVSPVLKRAFMFACVTGLRYCDIEKLTWSELHIHEEGCNIHFRQKKVQEQFLIHPFKIDFIHLLGERGNPDDRVFQGLYYGLTRSPKFDNWVKKSGINKSPTFHSSRHTYTCILLNKGVGIYVVSKMLGHKNVATTERTYAHIIPKTKQDAANQIDLKFGTR